MENVFDSKVIMEIKDDATWSRLVDGAENPARILGP